MCFKKIAVVTMMATISACSEDSAISNKLEHWSCTTEVESEQGIKMKVMAEVTDDLMSFSSESTAIAEITASFKPGLMSSLRIDSRSEYKLEEDIRISDEYIEKLTIVSDELKILLPEVMDNFKAKPPVTRFKIVNVDNDSTNYISENSGEVTHCIKRTI